MKPRCSISARPRRSHGRSGGSRRGSAVGTAASSARAESPGLPSSTRSASRRRSAMASARPPSATWSSSHWTRKRWISNQAEQDEEHDDAGHQREQHQPVEAWARAWRSSPAGAGCATSRRSSARSARRRTPRARRWPPAVPARARSAGMPPHRQVAEEQHEEQTRSRSGERSHSQQMPQVGRPQIEPVTSVSPVKTTPISAEAAASGSQNTERFRGTAPTRAR